MNYYDEEFVLLTEDSCNAKIMLYLCDKSQLSILLNKI